MASLEAKGWKEAVEKEYDQLTRKGVFEEVDELPDGKKAVGSKFILREKLDEHGNHVKFKAWLVAQGFSQIPGVDFHETFLSVAKFTTL
jgi:hypothetical protein